MPKGNESLPLVKRGGGGSSHPPRAADPLHEKVLTDSSALTLPLCRGGTWSMRTERTRGLAQLAQEERRMWMHTRAAVDQLMGCPTGTYARATSSTTSSARVMRAVWTLPSLHGSTEITSPGWMDQGVQRVSCFESACCVRPSLTHHYQMPDFHSSVEWGSMREG